MNYIFGKSEEKKEDEKEEVVKVKNIGKPIQRSFNRINDLYMFVREGLEEGTQILLFQRYYCCDNCEKYEDNFLGHLIPFPCRNCLYCELPILNSNSTKLTPDQDVKSRMMNFSDLKPGELKEKRITFYRINNFSYNVNFSQLIFLPMSRINTENETVYNVMIYQEDYHGNLQELIARPMGYTTLYEHHETSLQDVDFYDVSEKNSLKFEHIVKEQKNFVETYSLSLKLGTSSGFYNSIHKIVSIADFK